tara:strand:+ start:627 stop:800 length:174 start_codon:yes stop_codon:yes gene_type:complete
MIDIEENPEQRDVADYNAYLLLKDLRYTNEAAADHLSYTKQQLADLIVKFTFEDNVE